MDTIKYHDQYPKSKTKYPHIHIINIDTIKTSQIRERKDIAETFTAYTDLTLIQAPLIHEEVDLLIGTNIVKSLGPQYLCEILKQPETGIITDSIFISRPDAKREHQTLIREIGYRAHVKLSKDSNVFYQGPIYYQMINFNPIRSDEEKIEAKISFNLTNKDDLMSFRHPHILFQKLIDSCNGFCKKKHVTQQGYHCEPCSYNLCNQCFMQTRLYSKNKNNTERFDIKETSSAFIDLRNLQSQLSELEFETFCKNIAIYPTLPKKCNCILLSKPEIVTLSGEVYIMRPDNLKEKAFLKDEICIRAQIKLDNKTDINFSGFFYYRIINFSPIRSEADQMEAKVSFNQTFKDDLMTYRHPHILQKKFILKCKGFCEPQQTSLDGYACEACSYEICYGCFYKSQVVTSATQKLRLSKELFVELKQVCIENSVKIDYFDDNQVLITNTSYQKQQLYFNLLLNPSINFRIHLSLSSNISNSLNNLFYLISKENIDNFSHNSKDKRGDENEDINKIFIYFSIEQQNDTDQIGNNQSLQSEEIGKKQQFYFDINISTNYFGIFSIDNSKIFELKSTDSVNGNELYYFGFSLNNNSDSILIHSISQLQQFYDYK